MSAKLLLSFLIIISSIQAFAYEREYFSSQKGEHIVYYYEEQGSWHLKELLIKPGELQEEVFSASFQSKSQLISLKNSKYQAANFSTQKQMKFFEETELPTKSLWKVTNSWDENWEEKFIKWLEAEFDKDFFVKHQIVTDCADAAFALRWIFARMNALPAANTMAGSHILFTQDSMKKEWASIPTSANWNEDELFLTGLKYIMKHAFTGTLGIDGYPILINPDVFRVGTVHLDGGHTMIISKINSKTINDCKCKASGFRVKVWIILLFGKMRHFTFIF